jgi:hypothetical protein
MEDSLGKQKYGWSKYGGGNKGLETTKIHTDWCCQACGETQPVSLPPFKFRVEHREFIRICSSCYNKVKKQHIEEYVILISIVRKHLRFG